MLTAKQVGPLLGISARAVYELAASGLLPSYRPTASKDAVRFDPADVETYRQSRLVPPKPLLPGREARTLQRLTIAAAKVDGSTPEPLPPELQALADERVRNLRRAPWADSKAIAAIYAEARRLTAETGIAHHVDHEIPLLGTFVSGLHVETNLRVLLARDNILKSNFFEEA